LTRRWPAPARGELFDLVSGFVYTQVLLACVQAAICSTAWPRSAR
jgi:hypothetical protein